MGYAQISDLTMFNFNLLFSKKSYDRMNNIHCLMVIFTETIESYIY